MKKTTLTSTLLFLFVLTANSLFAQTTFVPKAVQTNNTVIQGLCEKVESHGWLYFKDDNVIDPYTYFEDYATEMGLTENDEMVTENEWDSEGMTHIKFKQYFKSIPVRGGVYTLHLKDCRVVLAHGKIVENLDISLPSTLSESTALQAALNAIGATTYAWQDTDWENELKEETENPNATYYPIGTLEIFGESEVPKIGSNFHLAYKFEITSIVPFANHEVYVDANNGNILRNFSGGLHSDGTCTTLFNGTQTITTEHRWLQDDYILKDKTRSIWTKYDPQDGTPWGFVNNITDDNNSWGTPDRNATSAHWAAEKAWDYYSNNWGIKGVDGKNKNLRIIANAEFKDEFGVSLNGLAKFEKFGNVDAIWVGRNFIDFLQPSTADGIGTLDIVGHEFTHGICKKYGLVGGGHDEQSALVESFCDIFGEVIEHYALGTHNWIQAGETGVSVTKRNLLNPNATGGPNSYMQTGFWDGTSNNDPHVNGQAQNRWFSLLSDGGSQNGVDLFNGLGFEKAVNITFTSLKSYIQEGATYADARSASIFAAKSLYGACSFEEKLTTNAWAAILVGLQFDGTCLQIVGPGGICSGVGSPKIWTANTAVGTVGWNYPSWWNCTVSGSHNEILTLYSFSTTPPFSMNVTIAATSLGITDLHTVWIQTGCIDSDPDDPCLLVERANKTKSGENLTENTIYKLKADIFPNPVNDKLTIVSGQLPNGSFAEIVNTLGIVISKIPIEGPKFEINTQDLASGVYFLKIIQTNGQELHTFYKNR